MAGLTLLHAADLHLGAAVAAPDPAVASLAGQARSQALGRLVKLAQQSRVDMVLLAGDLFDTPTPPWGAVAAWERACQALAGQGIRVFVTPGNHDPWQGGSFWESWNPPEGVHVFSPQPQGLALDDLGVWLAGVAHDQPHVETDLAARLPPPPPGLAGVALLHADLPSSRPSGSELPYAPARLEDMRAGPFALWALGHWHRPQVLSESPRVIMAGALQGAHLDETGPHGAWLVSLEAGAMQARFMPLAPLVFHDLVLDDLGRVSSPAALGDQVAAALPDWTPGGESQLCLRLRLSGPSPLWRHLMGEAALEAAMDLRQALGAAGLVLESQGVHPPVDPARLAQRQDVLGSLLGLIQNAGDDPQALAALEESLRPHLHPLAANLPLEERRQWLAELLPRVRSLALNALWQGGAGEEAPDAD